MPSQDSIDVRILVDGQPLQEYRDPETDLDDENLRTRYIEIKTGQKFAVRVKLLQGFELKYAKHVKSTVQIDDHAAELQGCSAEAVDMDTNPSGGGHLCDDFIIVDNWGGQVIWNEDQGEWTAVKWTFGALGYNDKDPKTCGVTPKQISELGSIVVNVYRARLWRDDGALQYFGGSKKPLKALDELPEALMKGAAIKNNTKFIVTHTARAPAPKRYHRYPVKGKNGRAYTFRFLYRSKKILQNLGCIARSPSPPPDTKLILERTEDSLRQEKERVAKLRAELANYKAKARQGSTIEADTPPRSVKREGAIAGIKRSRAEMEDDDDDVAEVAPPSKQPKVIIDISDDSD